MLRRNEDAYRAVAEIIAQADRDTRDEIVRVHGSEETYTVKFCTKIEHQLRNKTIGGIKWNVVTYNPTKQSEGIHGGDALVALNMDFGTAKKSKGFVFQAKVNQNVEKGVRVDNKVKLKEQCTEMLKRTPASFVFAYGESITKILNASDVVDALGIPLSELNTSSVSEFFYDVFKCIRGSEDIVAKNHRDLFDLAERFSVDTAMLITARSGGP